MSIKEARGVRGVQNKVVFDTSIYIPFINDGIPYSSPVFRNALDIEKPLIYMSAVVIEELYAGAFDKVSVKLLDKMYKTFENIGRLITPEASDWQNAGKVAAALGKKSGLEDFFLSGLVNDVLISLSARRIGAVVVTRNMKDFVRIKEFVNFKIYTIEA